MKESSYEMKCFHVSAIGQYERKKSEFYILREVVNFQKNMNKTPYH